MKELGTAFTDVAEDNIGAMREGRCASTIPFSRLLRIFLGNKSAFLLGAFIYDEVTCPVALVLKTSHTVILGSKVPLPEQ